MINLDVADVNQRGWLEQSGQWLENVDHAHLVQASGKPVLLKSFFNPHLYRSTTGFKPETVADPSRCRRRLHRMESGTAVTDTWTKAGTSTTSSTRKTKAESCKSSTTNGSKTILPFYGLATQ